MQKAAALVAALLLPAAAHAWQIEDPIHESCHERITQEALTEVGYVSPPPPLEGEDRRLPGSVQFGASAYDQNIYALSLILGVRFPDLHGAPDFDFDDLSRVHNALADQEEHCLRSEEQDGPGGDEQALRACRHFIERLYWDALASLDADGTVDPDQRILLPIHVPFAGTVQYPVSGFYANGGRALHALQDSFTHTYRTADQRRVTHVFNWSEQVRCTLEEPRDGHGHESILDDCTDANPTTEPRRAAALQASSELLAALTTPGSEEEHRQRLDTLLEEWLTYEPGCTLEDAYCENGVHEWVVGSGKSDVDICSCAGCGSAGQAPLASTLLGLGWVGTVLALGGRRRRRGGQSVGAALVVAALLVGAPAAALAVAPVPATGPAPAPGPVSQEGLRFEARASLSVQNPAYGVGGAALYRFPRVELGGFAELNPWYSFDARRMSFGATNAGLLAHYLHPLRDDLQLRAGVGLGLSILNEELIGSDAGTTGLFLNLRLLGMVFQLSDGVALTVDGFDLAVAAPQLTGWPIVYAQHRASVGLQF